MRTMRSERGRSHGSAKKRFGQHFLERPWAEKVMRAIAPVPDQTFFEIGPGRGAITGLLAANAQRVVAFEIDRDLAKALRQDAPPNLQVVEGDFLTVRPDELRKFIALSDPQPNAVRV